MNFVFCPSGLRVHAGVLFCVNSGSRVCGVDFLSVYLLSGSRVIYVRWRMKGTAGDDIFLRIFGCVCGEAVSLRLSVVLLSLQTQQALCATE